MNSLNSLLVCGFVCYFVSVCPYVSVGVADLLVCIACLVAQISFIGLCARLCIYVVVYSCVSELCRSSVC